MLRLPVGEHPARPPGGYVDLFADDSGQPQKIDAGGSVTPLGGRTGLISGGSSFASMQAAFAQANATGGQTIELGRGTYRLTAQSLFNANGLQLVGNGPGSTFLEIDDAGGMGGADALLCNSVLQIAIKGLSVVATTARTAGAFLRVKGKNNITATPAQRTRQYTVEDVDAEDLFDGVAFVNGDGGDGAWGGFLNRCEWIRFSAGGTYIDINSPAGGQHYVSNFKMYGSHSLADGARALAGLRYRGGADLECVNVNQIYMRNGYLSDPSVAAANVAVLTGCEWDNNTQASIKLAPSGSGSILGFDHIGGWGYTPAANSLPCVQIDGGTGIKFIGGQFWSNFQAFKLSGPAKRVLIAYTDSSGSAAGYYATNNAADFQILGNTCGILGGVTPTVGCQTDAGTDHFTITGNNFRECTTPITNTPGVSAGRRIVQDNIIA